MAIITTVIHIDHIRIVSANVLLISAWQRDIGFGLDLGRGCVGSGDGCCGCCCCHTDAIDAVVQVRVRVASVQGRVLVQQAAAAPLLAIVLDERRLEGGLPRKVTHARQLVVAPRTGTNIVEAGRRSAMVHGPILDPAPIRTATATLLQRILELAPELA